MLVVFEADQLRKASIGQYRGELSGVGQVELDRSGFVTVEVKERHMVAIKELDDVGVGDCLVNAPG